jgi:hypothetical protein
MSIKGTYIHRGRYYMVKDMAPVDHEGVIFFDETLGPPSGEYIQQF